MADASVPTSRNNIPSPVANRLRALRMKITWWFLVEGLAWLLLVLIALALCDFAVDRLLRLGWVQRCFLLGVQVVLLAGLAIWRLAVPLLSHLGDEALCMEVERRHRQLGQSLISAVQFSKMAQLPTGASPQLVQETIRQGTKAASGVDFSVILDARRYYRNLLLLAVGLVLVGLGVWTIASTTTGKIWFQRNVLLSASVHWPQRTYLEVQGLQDGNFVMPRGESRMLEVIVGDKSIHVPDDLVVDFRGGRRGPARKMQHVAGSDRRFRLELKSVYEKFEFRVRSADAILPWISDARTPWIPVVLVDQPEASRMDLTVIPPKYAGDKPIVLPPGKGPYQVLRGSRLTIAGRSNKPLSSAELVIDGQTQPLIISNAHDFSLSISPAQLEDGIYTVLLRDTEGIQSKRPTSFAIRILPDREPRLRATLQDISGMVVPKAVLPFTVNIDDDFAVTGVGLAYLWRGNDEPAGAAELVIPWKRADAQLPAADITLQDRFDLAPLAIPIGSTLTFKFQAVDNDDVSGPNTGYSSEFLLRVVSEEELRSDLLRREKEQRQTLEHLLTTQDELLTETEALAATISGKTELQPDQKSALRNYQRQQQSVGVNLATVSERLQSFLREIQNNRLEEEGGPLERRLMSRVVRPLNRLVEQEVPPAVESLDRARREATKPADRDAALRIAVAHQRALSEGIREILLSLVKAEGYQEAVNMLYLIEKSQQGVLDLTSKEMQERIRRILEGDKVKTPEKDDKTKDKPAPPESPGEKNREDKAGSDSIK